LLPGSDAAASGAPQVKAFINNTFSAAVLASWSLPGSDVASAQKRANGTAIEMS
jgi:hypothetical protein